MQTLSVAIALSLFAVAAVPAGAVEKGDKAPSFQAKDDTGKVWKSSEHVGKGTLVVYFYPADLTGGCTKQACGFRDDMSALKEKGVAVVGVSGDTVKNHQLFKQVHHLSFPLLADTSGKVAEAFGVPHTEGGRAVTYKGQKLEPRGVTTQRWTYVIDKDGKIAFAAKTANAAGDSKRILGVVESLK